MATKNWQVLDGDVNANAFRIAYYIPIPSATNAVGTNYQTALVNSGVAGGGKSVLASGSGPGQIPAADLTAVQAGSLFEFVELFYTNPGQNLATLTAAVNARLAALTTIKQAELQNQLKYFGGSG